MRLTIYFMLINFINLSADFNYIPTESHSKSFGTDDPVDTLSELMLEYVMDMPDNTIPDMPSPTQKEQIFKDFKIWYLPVKFDIVWCIHSISLTYCFGDRYWADIICIDIPLPPPEKMVEQTLLLSFSQ